MQCNAMQFFSSNLLKEGKNGIIEGKSEFSLFSGTPTLLIAQGRGAWEEEMNEET